MRLQKRESRRSGAAVVEAAIVVPVLLLILLGLISGALMVFVADEVSNAARQGARFGSVRGANYAFTTGQPAATPDDITAYVKQQGVLLDPSRITCNVSWQANNRPGSFITVEVHYQFPGIWNFGAQEFVSRSTMLVSY